jgi:hypothetical protein
VALAFALLVALFGGGVAASGTLSGTSTRDTLAEQVVITTTQFRTVREVVHGKVRIRRVPVVRRILAKPQTVREVSTILTPGGTRTVLHRVTKLVPVVRKRVVTVGGKTQTISSLVTVTSVSTQTQVVTNEHTQTVVNSQTATQTVTHNETATQVQTVTQVQMVTPPPDTVTVTVQGPTTTVLTTTTVLVPTTTTVTVTGP